MNFTQIFSLSYKIWKEIIIKIVIFVIPSFFTTILINVYPDFINKLSWIPLFEQILLIFGYLLSFFGIIALIQATLIYCRKQELNWSEIFKFSRRKYLKFIGGMTAVYFFTLIIASSPLMALTIASELGYINIGILQILFCLLLIPLTYIFLGFSFFIPVLITENLEINASLRRSWELMKGFRIKLSLYFSVIILLSILEISLYANLVTLLSGGYLANPNLLYINLVYKLYPSLLFPCLNYPSNAPLTWIFLLIFLTVVYFELTSKNQSLETPH